MLSHVPWRWQIIKKKKNSHCKVALATTHPPVLQQYLRKAAAANCTVAATNISSFEVINTCGCSSSLTTVTDCDSWLSPCYSSFLCPSPVRDGIAQLVEHQTEKPGAILMKVQFPGAARDFLADSAFSADCLTVSVQPPCAITCLNICAHVENPKHWQP